MADTSAQAWSDEHVRALCAAVKWHVENKTAVRGTKEFFEAVALSLSTKGITRTANACHTKYGKIREQAVATGIGADERAYVSEQARAAEQGGQARGTWPAQAPTGMHESAPAPAPMAGDFLQQMAAAALDQAEQQDYANMAGDLGAALPRVEEKDGDGKPTFTSTLPHHSRGPPN